MTHEGGKIDLHAVVSISLDIRYEIFSERRFPDLFTFSSRIEIHQASNCNNEEEIEKRAAL